MQEFSPEHKGCNVRCTAEVALSFLIAHLRLSMAPFKVEQMMFLRLNQDYSNGFRKYKAVVGSQKDRMYKCGREVQSMQLKTAGEIIEIDLP